MSDQPPDDEPSELDDLADRLSAGSDRSEEPVEAHDVMPAGAPWVLVGSVSTAVVLLLVATVAGISSRELWGAALVLVGFPVAAQLLNRGPALHLDDTGITLRTGSRSRRGLHRWDELLEVGWLRGERVAGSVLVLRPDRRPDPGAGLLAQVGFDRLTPHVVTIPVSGELPRAEVRDRLAHACRRHHVHFSEDEAARGTAPPDSPYR